MLIAFSLTLFLASVSIHACLLQCSLGIRALQRSLILLFEGLWQILPEPHFLGRISANSIGVAHGSRSWLHSEERQFKDHASMLHDVGIVMRPIRTATESHGQCLFCFGVAFGNSDGRIFSKSESIAKCFQGLDRFPTELISKWRYRPRVWQT